jgi:isochorismate synthase
LLGVGHLHELPLTLAAPASRSEITALLRGIPISGDEGPSESLPRAHAALPFDPSSAGSVVIPSVQIFATPDESWMTFVEQSASDLETSEFTLSELLSVVTAPDGPTPNVRQLVEAPDQGAFVTEVAAGLQLITAGHLSKLVLSRSILLKLERPIDPAGVLARLFEREPSCTLYSAPSPRGQFVGASPELLMERSGTSIRTFPLAGTRPQSDDRGAALSGSAKDLEEHRLVVVDIAERLESLAERLDVPEHPSIVSLRSVQHLGTEITGELSDQKDPRGFVLELLAAIHPTPAVAGVPSLEAMTAIRSIEGDDRECFAGAVGWLNGLGDGEWVLGIRGAILSNQSVFIRAGAGVVEGSTPTGELEETRVKLSSILSAVVPDGPTLPRREKA